VIRRSVEAGRQISREQRKQNAGPCGRHDEAGRIVDSAHFHPESRVGGGRRRSRRALGRYNATGHSTAARTMPKPPNLLTSSGSSSFLPVVSLLTPLRLEGVRRPRHLWVASATDFFDGWIARRRDRSRRLASCSTRSPTSCSWPPPRLARPDQPRFGLDGGRRPRPEFAVDGLRMIAVQRGVTIPASPLGKSRWSQSCESPADPRARLGEWTGSANTCPWVVDRARARERLDYFVKFWGSWGRRPPRASLRRSLPRRPSATPVVSLALLPYFTSSSEPSGSSSGAPAGRNGARFPPTARFPRSSRRVRREQKLPPDLHLPDEGVEERGASNRFLWCRRFGQGSGK